MRPWQPGAMRSGNCALRLPAACGHGASTLRSCGVSAMRTGASVARFAEELEYAAGRIWGLAGDDFLRTWQSPWPVGPEVIGPKTCSRCRKAEKLRGSFFCAQCAPE